MTVGRSFLFFVHPSRSKRGFKVPIQVTTKQLVQMPKWPDPERNCSFSFPFPLASPPPHHGHWKSPVCDLSRTIPETVLRAFFDRETENADSAASPEQHMYAAPLLMKRSARKLIAIITAHRHEFRYLATSQSPPRAEAPRWNFGDLPLPSQPLYEGLVAKSQILRLKFTTHQ